MTVDFLMGVLTALVVFCFASATLFVVIGWKFAKWVIARSKSASATKTPEGLAGESVTTSDGRKATIMTEYSLAYPNGRDVVVAVEEQDNN